MSIQRRAPARKIVVAPKRRAPVVRGRGDYAMVPKRRVQRRVVRGRGDYTMDPNQAFGKRWGGYVGSKLGEMVGGGAHNLISSITGLGDYSVRKNVFLGNDVPRVHNTTAGGTVIRHTEFLGDIFTASVANTFNIQSFNVNAADSVCFPFLSQIAANYEQYEFEGLLFEFKSTSADALNSTNTALGSVIMATQYDSYDTVFDSKTDMLNYEFSTSCKPSVSNLHMVECDPHQTAQPLFYSSFSGAIPTGADARLYNLGKFSIATTGFQGTTVNIGELHVTYQVRLLKPKMFSSLGLDCGSTMHFINTVAGAFSNASPLGLLALSTKGNSIPITINQTNRTITFPATSSKLYYRLEIYWSGTAAVLVYPVWTYANCTQQSASDFNAGVSLANAHQSYGIVTSGNGLPPVITLGAAGTLPTGSQSLFIRVMQVNPLTTAQ